MSHILDTYKRLRESGHTEEEALTEAKEFIRPSNGEIADLVTSKDLKIAFLEQEAKLEIKFNEFMNEIKSLRSDFNLLKNDFNWLQKTIFGIAAIVAIPYLKYIAMFLIGSK